MLPSEMLYAVWCARDIVGDEPFAVVLPDELVLNAPGCLAQMIEAAGKLGAKSNLLAVEAVPDDLTHQYGICGVGKRHQRANLFEVSGMVEKPPKGTAPSNLYIMGRYILQPEIFPLLSRMEKGAGGEIQITDAMVHLMHEQPFSAVRHRGTTYDCGSKIGFLTANVAFALARPDLGPELKAELLKLL